MTIALIEPVNTPLYMLSTAHRDFENHAYASYGIHK